MSDSPLSRRPGIFASFCDTLRDCLSERPLDCVQVEVTSHCTGRCTYCPHSTMADNWRSAHMDEAVFAGLLPLLRQCKRAHLQGWSEPMLHPRFFEMVDFARAAGCAVSSTTCGMQMDEERARRICESGMDVLAFSLVGTDTASNNARAGIPFDNTCRAIACLRDAQRRTRAKLPAIHLAYLLLPDRMEAVTALPGLMDELDVPVAVVSTLDFLAHPDHVTLAIAPDEADKIARARALLDDARERAERAGRTIVFALPTPHPAPVEGGCREHITTTLFVGADGGMAPCVYRHLPVADAARPEGSLCFGQLPDANALEIWKSPEWRAFRRNLALGQADAVCARCPKRHEEVG